MGQYERCIIFATIISRGINPSMPTGYSSNFPRRKKLKKYKMCLIFQNKKNELFIAYISTHKSLVQF